MQKKVATHIIQYILLNAFILAGVWGCRQDVDEFRPYPLSLVDLDPLFTQVPGPSTKTTFSLAGPLPDTVLTTASGIRLFLTDTEHLFVDANDNSTVPCSTCQTLSIEVTEATRKGDMLARNLPTVGENGQLLESGGMVRVRVICNGKPLALLPGRNIKIQLPQSNRKDDLFVYNGIVTQDSLEYWTPTTEPVYLADWFDAHAQETISGYEVIVRQLGWVNCAKPLSSGGTLFCVTLPEGFTNLNTVAFIVFKQDRVLVPLKEDPVTHRFCAPDVPAGYLVKIITISKFGNQYWLSQKDTETGTNSLVNLSPEVLSEQDVLGIIKGL